MLQAALKVSADLAACGLLTGAAMVAAEVLVARNGSAGARPAPMMPEWEPGIGIGQRTLTDVPNAAVVWLGDSTAVGYGASSMAAGLPERLTILLDLPPNPLVLAQGGARVRDVVVRQLPLLDGQAPPLVFISVGANDTMHLTSKPSFRRDYERVLSRLPEDARVVMLGVPDMGALLRLPQPLRAMAGRRSRSLDGIVRSLATAQPGSRRHVDVGGLVGPLVRSDPRRYLAVDGYHPNDTGYQLCAHVAAAVLRLTDFGHLFGVEGSMREGEPSPADPR